LSKFALNFLLQADKGKEKEKLVTSTSYDKGMKTSIPSVDRMAEKVGSRRKAFWERFKARSS
jgi:hypothetical protein